MYPEIKYNFETLLDRMLKCRTRTLEMHNHKDARSIMGMLSKMNSIFLWYLYHDMGFRVGIVTELQMKFNKSLLTYGKIDGSSKDGNSLSEINGS